MKKVYAVSAGSYSNYRVNAIFSTRKRAEAFKRAVPDDAYNDIEEYELDPPTADLLKRGYSVWLIHMLIDGNIEIVKKRETRLDDVDYVGYDIWRRSQALAFQGTGIPDILTATVWAKTEKQAIKIVNEHRARLIATGIWEQKEKKVD